MFSCDTVAEYLAPRRDLKMSRPRRRQILTSPAEAHAAIGPDLPGGHLSYA